MGSSYNDHRNLKEPNEAHYENRMNPRLLATMLVMMLFLAPASVGAQPTSPRPAVDDDHTAREEAEGKAVWEKLRSGSTQCADLSDQDYGALGEHFMGQMMGDAHAGMNATMTRMLGEDGEEQMHVVMGKRMSGCAPDTALPAGAASVMPMMMGGMMGGGMTGGWSPSSGTGWSRNAIGMMGFAPWGSGWFGGIGMVIWWAFIILAIVALIRWMVGHGRGRGKSAREILEERYARGEISKTEFEEKRRALDHA